MEGASTNPLDQQTHLDDLHQLVHAALTGEDRLTQQELGKDATGGPHIWWQ